jgi:hypothetical protein
MMKISDFFSSDDEGARADANRVQAVPREREGSPRRGLRATVTHVTTRVLVAGAEHAGTTGQTGEIVSSSMQTCTLQLEVIGDFPVDLPPPSGAHGGVAPVAADRLPEDMSSLGEQGVQGDETIIGSGDRAHHLALKYAHVSVSLRAPRAAPSPLITPGSALAPGQRHRRCLQSGFCDPASPLGCGGQYCSTIPDF